MENFQCVQHGKYKTKEKLLFGFDTIIRFEIDTIKFFVWKMLYNFLSIDSIFQSRGYSLASKCVRCDNVEDIVHVFYKNQLARGLGISF